MNANLIRHSAFFAVLLALAACGGPGNDNASTDDQTTAETPATTTKASHALSGYKQQLDKAKAVEEQLKQHDQQRRKALQAMEQGSTQNAGDDTE